jgi:uridine kinase
MPQRPLVIAIAGGTASGKTTVARRIVEGLRTAADEETAVATELGGFIRDDAPRIHGPVSLLDLDSYYRELADLSLEEKRSFNWDHPDAFDAELIVDHLKELKAGRSVEKPVYSFAAYSREVRTTTVRPGEVVVVEGILVLALEPLRRECDVRIFVDADDDVRVIRRLTRDIKERGRDFDSVVEQYFRTVRPMHNGFVEPSKRHADIIIPHGGSNETAIQMVVSALRARLAGRRGTP